MLTERFPFLIPLRKKQRKLCYYAAMRLNGDTYCRNRSAVNLPYTVFCASGGLYNTQTGFDMLYQENKVFNLKLAALPLDGLIIKPGETFSLLYAIRNADRHTRYKEGLAVTGGKLGVVYGGGLCQISNLLYWLFLHTPLTVTERHTHRVKDFPTMRSDEPEGVDATISEGWKDLKVKNLTKTAYQIRLDFSEDRLEGIIYADALPVTEYRIKSENLRYFRERDGIYQKVSVLREEISPGGCAENKLVLSSTLLYENICRIGYNLPDSIRIAEGAEVTA